MPISFGSQLSSASVNNNFLDKTINDAKKGVLGLYKTLPGDADAITDTQNFINKLATVDGVAGEGDLNATTYSSTNNISNGDNRKVAIGKLDAALKLLQDDVAAGTIKFKGYISDSAYVTANGAAQGGDVYYNSTTGKVRFYDDVELAWKVIGDQVVGVQENIGVGNGSNTGFTITNAPLNDEALNVYVNGVLAYKEEYTISLPTITFLVAPSIGSTVYVSYLTNGSPASPVISVGTNVVAYLSILPADVTNKFKTLASAPIEPTKILVDAVGGTTLQYGVDFNVIGADLNWNGFLLDGIIANGDVLRVQYFN
jgi:hypothetical protein